MKKMILLFAVMLPMAVFAQVSNPPQVKDITMSDLQPFIKGLAASLDTAGGAKAMVDALDASKMLRMGARRHILDGQNVYYEQYSIHASLKTDVDGSGCQSVWSEGQARKTGEAYITRESSGKDSFIERIDYLDEGFMQIYGASASLQSAVDDKSKQSVGDALLQIAYTPIQVRFGELKQLSELREGGSAEVELLLTDLNGLYMMDGYEITVSSSSTEVLTIGTPKVITGSDGRAKITVLGVKKGKADVRVLIDLHEDRTNSHIHSEREIEVEVKGPERWEYSIRVHDEFTLPAHDYTLHGEFEVSCSTGEDGVTHYHISETSNVSMSTGLTFSAHGEFLNETDRTCGVAIGFDLGGILQRAEQAQAQIGANIGNMLVDMFASMATGQKLGEVVDSPNPITMAEFILEEGSWPFMMRELDYLALNGGLGGINAADLEGLSFAEAMEKMEQMEAEKEKADKKNKKNGKKNKKEEEQPIEMDQAAAMQEQINYIKQHHCLLVPDATQLMFPSMGNFWLDGDKIMNGTYDPHIAGNVTLKKLDDE